MNARTLIEAEQVVAAALRVGGVGGSVYIAPDHFRCFQQAQEAGDIPEGTDSDEWPAYGQQGFVTTFNRFVTREEAYRLARASGQVRSMGKGKQPLASDDLGPLKEGVELPDGSGFFTASFPLPKSHWLYAEKHDPVARLVGGELRANLIAAGRYAVRGATMRGKVMDFDPDALVQNLVSALLGGYDPDEL